MAPRDRITSRPAVIRRPAIGRIGRAMPVFRRPVDLAYRGVAPARITCFRGEAVPVGSVSARPGAGVDARSAAQYPAHRQFDGSIAETRVWLRLESPVTLRSQVSRPLCGVLHGRNLVGAAGLDQQHTGIPPFSEPPSDHRPARTRTAYHEIVMIPPSRRQAALILTYPNCKRVHRRIHPLRIRKSSRPAISERFQAPSIGVAVVTASPALPPLRRRNMIPLCPSKPSASMSGRP